MALSQTEQQTSFLANSGFTLFLKALQAFCIAALLFCTIATFVIPDQYNRFLVYDTALFAVIIFLFLFSGQIAEFSKGKNINLKRRAALYSNLLPQPKNVEDSTDEYVASRENALVESREKALEYCQELIDDYKKVRKTSRTYYYVFQLSTIILSGVTPILVLLDKQVSIPYLRWLPVIFPALAAIVTSVATSFPFQERWVNANRVVEKLEAEQEKFVLGVTEPYRAFMFVKDDQERLKKVKLSIENFIVEVNKIHLQQVELPPNTAGDQEGEPAGDRDG